MNFQFYFTEVCTHIAQAQTHWSNIGDTDGLVRGWDEERDSEGVSPWHRKGVRLTSTAGDAPTGGVEVRRAAWGWSDHPEESGLPPRSHG